MTTYTFPAVTPTTSTFELITNTKKFQSPLSGAVQTADRKGARWRVTMSFKNLSGVNRALMQSFLAKLNGQEHRFYLQDHSYTKRGAGSGTIDVKGASQTGSTLLCDGASFAVTNILREGDYIAFNNELHMVTTDASSDGSGNVTLTIAPPIRKPTNDNDLIDTDVPVLGVFMLGSKAAWSNSVGLFSDFSIEAIEDVLA